MYDYDDNDVRMAEIRAGVDKKKQKQLETDLERAERRIDFLLEEVRALRRENEYLRRQVY